ncbi:inositol monophosphatase family protein [uncultured Roseovarius sp.]|uniref:inositol monophosphatase family protein n=1 Tax=uncultured Roseovarius sp. TaxID=293344 RepID=UPI002615843E|nr:inositol monophosphatase family protein [uncultured Roseovarius sp.]
MSDLPPHAEFLSFAEKLADRSRSMLLDASQRAPDVEIKQDASFVTATDKAVEVALREMIQDTYPDHGILGEEFENTNTDAEFVWVLDPIDGTAALVAGIPVYGSLIGLAWNGAPFVGVIEHPMTSDRWVGVAGSFARFNGNPIRVRSCASMATAYATCSNRDFMSASEQAKFDRVREQVQYVQYGGSCYSYGVLASGRVDLALDGGLDAFDIYAPAAVITGAGGLVTDWNGDALSFDMNGNVLAAGDKALMEKTMNVLHG